MDRQVLSNGTPPAGEEVVWQRWCPSMESARYGGAVIYRWAPVGGDGPDGPGAAPAPPSAEDVAAMLYEQIQGNLPEPQVSTDPPVGADAVVGVPVFVHVSNWDDEVVESHDLLGVPVTVTASPELVLDPAEPGSSPVTCTSGGVPYRRGGGDLWDQAAASDACTHAYELRTGVEGRPEEWASTASVRWSISWSAGTGESGAFPVVERSVAIPRGVSEVQALVTDGGR